jgi:hypothetical protein
MRKNYLAPKVTEHGATVTNTLGMVGGFSENGSRLP